jgi:hypothetical protein
MSWLRLDDGFYDHPKVLALPVRDRWAWVSLLCYVARYGHEEDRGLIPPAAPMLSEGLLERLLELRLVDVAEEYEGPPALFRVHDWARYNGRGRGAELSARVAEALERFPSGSANELVAAVGGRRVDVLAEVRRQREAAGIGADGLDSRGGGSRAGSGSGSAVVPDRFPGGSRSAHARAFPSPSSKEGTGSLDVAPAALSAEAPAPVAEGPPACPYCGGRPAELVPHLLERHRGELERDSAGAPFSSLEAFAGVVARSAARA